MKLLLTTPDMELDEAIRNRERNSSLPENEILVNPRTPRAWLSPLRNISQRGSVAGVGDELGKVVFAPRVLTNAGSSEARLKAD